MKRVVALVGLALVGGLGVGVPALAQASSPPAFNGQYIIDDTSVGVVGSRAAELTRSVQDFAEQNGVQLFVVYVDEFDSPSDPQAWGSETAQKNYLGEDSILLSVAVEDRLYDLNAPEALVSDAQYDKISSEFVRPALKASDWSGVVEATLNGIDKTVLNTSSGAGGAVAAVVGGVVVVGGVGAGIALARKNKRKRQGDAAQAEQAQPSLEELEAQASALLVGADDDLRSSQQELGFAEAQFGMTAAEPFAAAIEVAKDQLTAAFKLRQQLDDNVPDTDADRRAWLTEIIERCTNARQSLAQQTEAFSRLREVEQRAPLILEQLRAAHAQIATQIATSREAAAGMLSQYSETFVAQANTNLAEAEARLTFVGECIDAAAAELTAGTTSTAAVTLRAGEAALEQARTLAESPAQLAGELAQATEQFTAAALDLRGDLEVVGQLIGSANESDRAALTVAANRVSELLQRGVQGDPNAALAAAAAANVQIDAAIGAARENGERESRAAAARDAAISSARGEVLNAEQFIDTRRGAVGESARTRLNEAKRQLRQAEQLAAHDPAKSYEAAQLALEYARAAYSLASSDVSGWGGGPQRGGGSSGDLGGAILGGIIGGLLSGGGGGGRGGGWSGSNGGFTGGWGGGSGGGGRRGGGGRF